MIFNFDIPMHLNMFRYLAAQAAEENTQRGEMMSQLKIRKARKGLYAGLGIIPTGFIVDYDKRSKTFEKIIPYPPHAKVVLGFFKRYFELEGNLQKLCRELEEKAVIFPEFEDWVDERIVHMWKRRKVPGGYKITDKGLRLLLTNPIYIGWWIVMGEVIFRDNHERIIPEEYEYFFWFAFDRLSPVTTEGERNEERIYLNPTRRRFYQKHTKERSALLKDRAAFPDGEVSVHSYDNKSHYCLIPPYTMRQTGWKEIQSSIVDDAFTDRFFERLGQTTEFRDFQAWIAQETRKQTSDVAMIDMQLVQLEAKQEAIIDDRLSLRQQITLIRDDEQREKAEKQAQPTFDLYLRQADKLERTKEDLVKKRERAVKNQALDTARKYATFQIELKELHDTWDDKPFDRKLEFVNLFVTKAVLTLPASHFVQLDIHWSHPLWGRDSLIIFRKIGASPYWTTPEKELIRRLYPRAQREELLSQLPFKTWASIKTEAKALGVKREIATASEIPDSLSWSDWVFMQEHEITTQMLYSKLDTQC